MSHITINATETMTQTRRYAAINKFIERIQFSSVPGRLFLFFLTGSRALGAYVPSTSLGQIFVDAQPIGIFVAAVALLGLLDTIVNDVLPDKYHIDFALSVRHVALMLCAAFFGMAVYLTVDTGFSWTVIPEFVACALTISVHTFLDLRRRLKWST